MSGSKDRLWVLWENPRDSIPKDAHVLSFLSTAEEESLVADRPLIRAREAVQGIRTVARNRYLRLVSQLGLAKVAGGKTLRGAIASSERCSRWWFHPVSFKDPDGSGDIAYERLLAIETVREEAKRLGVRDLVLIGAAREIQEVLSQGFSIEAHETKARYSFFSVLVFGFASRLKGFLNDVARIRAARTLGAPRLRCDVALFGFWDWSVEASDSGELKDRYFKALPGELSSRGLNPGWLLWFDPEYAPGSGGRKLRILAQSLWKNKKAVLLQQWLSVWDAVNIFSTVSPFLLFFRNRNSEVFLSSMRDEDVNYASLFEERLLKGFVDSSMPRYELAALASERALSTIGSKLAVTFHEHWSYGRSFAEGARRAGVLSGAMQHASVCRDKTFYSFDPKLEFAGEPDGCAVPRPDHVFSMGAFGHEIFLEAGHSSDRVHLTGSARYDHILDPKPVVVSQPSDILRVLVVLTLELSIELDMLEAAAIAVKNIEGVEIRCRNYPWSRIDNHPRYKALGGAIPVTEGSLDENLAEADLVLMSYSTVGEESLIAGKPVWQWLSAGYSGSSLAEVEQIPRFGSPSKLREALMNFKSNRECSVPNMETRKNVLERLFYKGDGGAAGRMADVIERIIDPSNTADIAAKSR